MVSLAAAISAVVGFLEGHGHQHGPEDFLPHHFHVRAGVHQHGRLDEIAAVAVRRAAGHGARAFVQARLQIAADPAMLTSDTSGPISVSGSMPTPSLIFSALAAMPAVTLSKIFSCTNRREPALQHWPWLKKMPAVAPAMAASISASSRMMLGDLPPSSRLTLLQVARRGLHDQLAHFGRAGEGDLVDVGMRGQRRAGRFAKAGHDIDHAVGKARFHAAVRPAAAPTAAFLPPLSAPRCSRWPAPAPASRPPSAAGNSRE